MRMHSALLLALSLFFVAPAATFAASAKVWVCPMPQHTQQFDKPGTCPICGMKLVEKDSRFRAAVLIFDSAEDIDFTAPIEVLGEAGAEVFTVGATAAPIRTVFGLHITPDFDLDHAPAADLLLIPGGGVGDTMKNPRVISWIRQRAAASRYVMSVCNGAFFLAKAGLLDGLTATTTSGRIEELATEYPKVHVVRKRFVDNEKVITTAGLSAGIDGALHVMDREYGRTRAENIARGLEYRWQPDSQWTRAAYADTRMPDVHLPDDAVWNETVSHGDTNQWEVRGTLRIAFTQEQLLDYATKDIVSKGWTLRNSGSNTRSFLKKDLDGTSWLTTIVSQPDAAPSTFVETMSVRKVVGS